VAGKPGSKSKTIPPSAAQKAPERRKPVVIVQHAPHEHPAALLRALESQGIATQLVHPYRGDLYPSTDAISGVVSLGGPMGANDQEHQGWIQPEMELFRRAVGAGLPVVGICLGGQILARALGGRVEKHSVAEVGWFPVQLNAQGLQDPIVGAAGPSPTVYHWHMDTFFPPEGATLLASSRACERQAYRISEKVYGFQFHPEADHQLVLEWLEIEGVHEDISSVQEEHGAETVQDPQTQRGHALRGEQGSLQITAAIASLFRQRTYNPIATGLREKIDGWTNHRTELVIEFEDSARKLRTMRGKIMTLLSIPSGDYLIFQGSDAGATLWPIRLDDLRDVRPVG
jgi:GMP synthase (glutamine-hydrolysing)